MSLRQKFNSMRRQPTELIAREQPPPPPDTTAAATWLQRQFEPLHRALGQLLADEREKISDQLERKTAEFDVKLAKLTGAVDVLRGAAPPPAKFPSVKAWRENAIHYKGEVVTHNGGTWQAQRDTARAPDTSDWVCVAAAGAGFAVCGTYDCNKKYKYLDVVITNGSSFASLKDAPGPCPGDDWHLLASRGSRGQRGAEGARGLMGLRGERGAAALTIRAWEIDRTRYVATPLMSDGSSGPPLELRALFEQFFLETSK
jgi:hypothetical protein